MNIYFISGLGADKRIFQRLVLPSRFKPVYLDWIHPMPGETLAKYASRMALLIDSTSPFYLVGVSFGGMIATEIAKQVSPQKTVILSSISTSNQLPWHYQLIGKLYIDQIIPTSFLTATTRLTYWLFGATDSSTKQLLKQVLNGTDKHFIRWALRALLTWNNQSKPANLIQVQGVVDRILPMNGSLPDFRIPAGGHLMVYNKSIEISNLLLKLLT